MEKFHLRTVEEIQNEMDQVIAVADARDEENRSLNDEEVARYEALEKELKAANKSAEIRARNEAYKSPVITGAPAIIRATSKGDDTLERAFEHYLRTGIPNSDIVQLRAQSVGADSAGGYMVPTGFRQTLTERMKAFGGIQSVAEVITTPAGNPLPWPTNDDTSNTGEIAAEGAAGASGDDLIFGTKQLGAYKFVSLGSGNNGLRVSVELLQDAAFDVQGFVARKLGQRIARAQAVKFAVGAGTTEPEGLMNRAATTSLVTSGTITYGELIDLTHDVDPAYRDLGAVWIMNDTTLGTVEKLEDSNGRPLLVADRSEPASRGRLLGYPVIVDQGVASLGTSGAKAIAFGAIREGFVIRRVADVSVLVDPYSRAKEGEVEFTAWARADSLIQDANAYGILADKA